MDPELEIQSVSLPPDAIAVATLAANRVLAAAGVSAWDAAVAMHALQHMAETDELSGGAPDYKGFGCNELHLEAHSAATGAAIAAVKAALPELTDFDMFVGVTDAARDRRVAHSSDV